MITVVNFSDAGIPWSSVGSLSVPAPASIQANDIIVVIIVHFSSGSTISKPDASWTQIGIEDTDGAGNIWQDFYWHVATGSGDGPWSFSLSPNDYVSAWAVAFRGCNTTAPIDTTAVSSEQSRLPPSLASPVVTPNYNGGLLFAPWTGNLNSTEYTLDASLNSIYNVPSQFNASSVAGWIAAPNAGVASAQYTTTADNGGGSYGMISRVVVLKAATPPAVEAIVTWRERGGY